MKAYGKKPPAPPAAPISKNPATAKREIQELQQKILEKIARHPEKAAHVLSHWINGTAAVKSLKKAS